MPGRLGTEADHAVLIHILRQADPDGRLRADAAFGVTVQADEVHAQLGKLVDVGEVVVAVPPVGSLGEIVKGLDAARLEERLAGFVERGKRGGNFGVGDHVAVKVEADAEFFGEAVGAVKDAGIVAADDPEGLGAILGANRFEEVLFGLERGGGGLDFVRGGGDGGAVFAGDDDGAVGGVGDVLAFMNRGEQSRAQVEVACGLARGKVFYWRSPLGPENRDLGHRVRRHHQEQRNKQNPVSSN